MTRRILWVLVVLSAIIGIAVALERVHFEGQNRRVELVLDWPSAQQLAAVSGQDLSAVAAALQAAGVYAAAIPARSAAEYAVDGRPVSFRVQQVWQEQVSIRDTLAGASLGFWDEDLELAAEAGLAVVPRWGNPPWDQDALWAPWLDSPPHLVIFSGREIPGYPDDLAATKEKLGQLGSLLGLIEFSNQKGIAAAAADTAAVRVHGISAAEMEKLSPERVIARYLRAVRERNIRVLYLRTYHETAADLPRSTALVEQLSAALRDAGYSLGRAQPLPEWTVTPIIQLAAWMGLAAGVVLLLNQFIVLKIVLQWAAAAAVWFLLFLILQLWPQLAQQAAAFLGALVFPTLAAVRIPQAPGPRLRMVAETVLISAVGALIVVASLGTTDFMLKLAEFRGVKVAHALPVVAVIVFGLLWKNMPVRSWSLLARRLQELWNEQVAVKYLAVGAAAAAAAFVYLSRTGNFGLPALEFELQFREWLERTMLARPRLKELFIGYPALWWAGSSLGRWSWWISLAVIGQISFVNSFSHIHTPILISLLRSVYGLACGLLLGFVLEWLWRRYARR